MKIYIATSWKMEKLAKSMADLLRRLEFEVDLFCDPTGGRYVFSFADLGIPKDLDQFDVNNNPKAQRAFAQDRRGLDWADVVIMMTPCGNSAHLEAGYACGHGKKLFIYGAFLKGQIDVMYQFADRMFRQVRDLIDALQVYEQELKHQREDRHEQAGA